MKRMQGFEVLHPFGWDAFGLPAENAAMKRGGMHPETWTLGNIAKGRHELKMMGILYDWDREVISCLPDYYKWTEWLFLLFYERGLAYRAMAPVNWCPVDKTVLANEQVINGRCWRHPDVEVEKRDLEQWFFKDHRLRGSPAGRPAAARQVAREGAAHADELDRTQLGG